MSIKHIIKKSGKCRKQICHETGLSAGHLSMMESGERKVSIKKIEVMCRSLSVGPGELRPDWGNIFKKV